MIRVLDPFGGDGRLIEWLIEAWLQSGFPVVKWDVAIWDLDDVGFDVAKQRLERLEREYGINCLATFKEADAFSKALKNRAAFDVVITNPPWELLKPDRRELRYLQEEEKASYLAKLRDYDQWLGKHYPLSQPRRKFAGWGTNLSRVGLEASLSLLKKNGVLGAVLPASMFADDQSRLLREHVLTQNLLLSTNYYPAEAKVYGSADVESVAVTLVAGARSSSSLKISSYNVGERRLKSSIVSFDRESLRQNGYVIPVSFGSELLGIAQDLSLRFPAWSSLESAGSGGLWAGRELDETGISQWLDRPTSAKDPMFIKGRMIGRYSRLLERPQYAVRKPGWSCPSSVCTSRIAWRDVSRPSQKRRMIATIVGPGLIAGNSVGVAYFRDLSEVPLRALLGVMNSMCFEFQLRAHLATAHVSLSSLRKVAVPSLEQLYGASVLARLVSSALDSCDERAPEVDAYVACRIYGLGEAEYCAILKSFSYLSEDEREAHLAFYRKFARKKSSARVKVTGRRMMEKLCEAV